MGKPCEHTTLVRAKTGGWFCVDMTGCDFAVAETRPAPPSSKTVTPAKLRNVADWLMNGCDIGQAAVELRILAQDLESAGETGDVARRTAEYWKAEHNAANDVIAEVREILGEFNSEDVQVMARRAIEKIRELEQLKSAFAHDAAMYSAQLSSMREFVAGAAVETAADSADEEIGMAVRVVSQNCDLSDLARRGKWLRDQLRAYGLQITRASEKATAHRCGDGCPGCEVCRARSDSPPEQVKTSPGLTAGGPLTPEEIASGIDDPHSDLPVEQHHG